MATPETESTATAAKTEKAAPAPAAAAERGRRRAIVGVITSDKMDRTVVVMVSRLVKDMHFHKRVTRRDKYMAHDETNQYKTGDRVEIVQTRPLSKNKCWRVSRLLDRPKEA